MRPLLILFLIFFLSGCETSDYPGFKRIDNSLHVKLVTVGDEDMALCLNCYITLDIGVYDDTQKMIAIKHIERVEMNSLAFPEPIIKQLLDGSAGDSLIFKGKVKDFEMDKWLKPVVFDSNTHSLSMSVKVEEVLTPEQLVTKRAEERVRKDLETQGARWLSLALDSLKFLEAEAVDGIYYRELEAGKGKKVKNGEFVTAHYIAKLPNGELLDNTYIGSPLEFEVGRPDQVLEGFAIGLSKMSVGGKALMLIPYQFAFGDKGSTEGIVPPFAPIIYEVELVDAGP